MNGDGLVPVLAFAAVAFVALALWPGDVPVHGVGRVHVYAQRDRPGGGYEVAEFLYRPEAEADEIEHDMRASGWTTRRALADLGRRGDR